MTVQMFKAGLTGSLEHHVQFMIVMDGVRRSNVELMMEPDPASPFFGFEAAASSEDMVLMQSIFPPSEIAGLFLLHYAVHFFFPFLWSYQA